MFRTVSIFSTAVLHTVLCYILCYSNTCIISISRSVTAHSNHVHTFLSNFPNLREISFEVPVYTSFYTSFKQKHNGYINRLTYSFPDIIDIANVQCGDYSRWRVEMSSPEIALLHLEMCVISHVQIRVQPLRQWTSVQGHSRSTWEKRVFNKKCIDGE